MTMVVAERAAPAPDRGVVPGPALTPGPALAESWRHAAALGRSGLDAAVLFWDPRRIQTRWLADLSQITDSYLRSPAFIEAMHCNLKAMTRWSRLVFPFSLPYWRKSQ